MENNAQMSLIPLFLLGMILIHLFLFFVGPALMGKEPNTEVVDLFNKTISSYFTTR